MLFRSVTALAASLMVLACAASSRETQLDVIHDPCSLLTVSVSSADTREQADVDAGIALWNGAAGLALRRVDATEPAGVTVVFQFAPAAMRGLYDDERSIIFVNSNAKTALARSITVAHELGHAFGMQHVTNTRSLMNPGNVQVPPTSSDVANLRALWPSCSGPR